jgi:hypothetical protein
MKKLKLDPESLHVESFASNAAPEDHGTVQGHQGTRTRPVFNTCQLNCGTTVQYTVCNTDPCM